MMSGKTEIANSFLNSIISRNRPTDYTTSIGSRGLHEWVGYNHPLFFTSKGMTLLNKFKNNNGKYDLIEFMMEVYEYLLKIEVQNEIS